VFSVYQVPGPYTPSGLRVRVLNVFIECVPVPYLAIQIERSVTGFLGLNGYLPAKNFVKFL
jgi:hypothetical protein